MIDFSNYGICIRQKIPSENYRCKCLKFEWKGIDCEYWKPFRGTTYEELGKWQQKMFKKEVK